MPYDWQANGGISVGKKVVGAIIGLLIGLAVSYLFKPQSPLLNITAQSWFTEGFQDQQTAPTIIICGVVGAVLGFVTGLFLDKSEAATLQPDSQRAKPQAVWTAPAWFARRNPVLLVASVIVLAVGIASYATSSEPGVMALGNPIAIICLISFVICVYLHIRLVRSA